MPMMTMTIRISTNVKPRLLRVMTYSSGRAPRSGSRAECHVGVLQGVAGTTGQIGCEKSCGLDTSCVSPEPILADLVQQRAVREPEQLRGARAVPLCALERATDERLLQLIGLALDREITVRGSDLGARAPQLLRE